jgi:hypothetical protein
VQLYRKSEPVRRWGEIPVAPQFESNWGTTEIACETAKGVGTTPKSRPWWPSTTKWLLTGSQPWDSNFVMALSHFIDTSRVPEGRKEPARRPHVVIQMGYMGMLCIGFTRACGAGIDFRSQIQRTLGTCRDATFDS